MFESLPWPVVVGMFSLGGAVVAFAVATFRLRSWVTETALEAIESREGRTTVASIAAERQVRIEDKLDNLTRSVGEMVTRLESRLDNMQVQVTQQISKLDAETRQLEIRLARIEHNAR